MLSEKASREENEIKLVSISLYRKSVKPMRFKDISTSFSKCIYLQIVKPATFI